LSSEEKNDAPTLKYVTRAHYGAVIEAIRQGRVVPFVGAGVNRCGRPEAANWAAGQWLPDGRELARHLAERFKVPEDDLLRVAQRIAVTADLRLLYDVLHDIFDADYPPTAVHTFLAGLPSRLREKNCKYCRQLIVTTNYDDVLERAFLACGEPAETVVYMAQGSYRGQFVWWGRGGELRPIGKFTNDLELSFAERSLILKVHGSVDRQRNPPNGPWNRPPSSDSYVITEDDYIEYLTRTDLAELLPASIAARLQSSSFLFLGYSLADWNLRAILHRIRTRQEGAPTSWAVQEGGDEFERASWEKRGVRIQNLRLEGYMKALPNLLEEIT
jgi:SIR2-like domain